MARRGKALEGLAAVLFDLDGVLVDSYRVWFHLLNHAASAWGYPAIDADTFAGCWGQGIEADRERFYPRHAVPELERFFAEHFAEHLAHLAIFPRLPELFARLRERGLPTAVVTNSQRALAEECVARAGIRPDAIVSASDVRRPKPAPDVVLAACAAFAVPPAAALVVGDSRYDREAAAAAGARFAGVSLAGGELELAEVGDLLAHL